MLLDVVQILLLLCATTFAQKVLITGKITDIEQNPIEGVSVKMQNTGFETSTDKNGYYMINEPVPIKKFVYSIEKKHNFSIKNRTVNFYALENGVLKITLFNLKGILLEQKTIKCIGHNEISLGLSNSVSQNNIIICQVTFNKKSFFTKLVNGTGHPLSVYSKIAERDADGYYPKKEKEAYNFNKIRKDKNTDTLIITKSGFASQRWSLRRFEDTVNIDMVTHETHETEIYMQHIVNNHRLSMGLDTLLWNDVAAHFARRHSRNISLLLTPFGHDGFSARIDSISENVLLMEPSENLVAGYQTPEAALTGWLSSPGHKKNIENKYSNVAGIGFYRGSGKYNNVYTQIFFIGDL